MEVDGSVSDGVSPQRITFATGETTSRTDRMTIKSNGNVGIGTSSPLGKLHVEGEIYNGDPSGNGYIRFLNVSGVSYIQSANSTGSAEGDLHLGNYFTNGRMVIKSGGNVGIGTDSPLDKLHVLGDLRLTQAIPEIKFRSPNDVNQYFIGANISDSVDGGLRIGRGSGIGGGNPSYIDMNSSGYVGINTNGASLTYNLQVDGSLYATSANFSGNVNIGGTLDLTNTGVIGALDMSNNSIYGVNNLSFADPGAQEGITWAGGNGWYIYESPDNLTNAAGNLQIVQGSIRRASFKTDGTFEVVGALIATTKSFDIEHPTKENMRLRYGSLEGPENGVYVRGKSSSSTITLPDYWTGLVDPDSITVQVTSIGKHKNLYVKDISDNTVTIGGARGEFEFFYFIQAERIDVDKLVVEYGS
jgi:hypothetical protein